LRKGKEPKKHKAHPEPPADPSLLCVPGKKGHVHRLEKSSQDFKANDETDAQVRFLLNLV
jgi:hypothetical protein